MNPIKMLNTPEARLSIYFSVITLKNNHHRGNSLVVRILCFHCRGAGLIPGQGAKILQAAWYAKAKISSAVLFLSCQLTCQAESSQKSWIKYKSKLSKGVRGLWEQ